MVDMECFCSDVKYGDTCTGNCGLAWERAQYLNWLNDTCFPLGNVSTMPGNWTTLLSVQRSEMIPGSWDLTPNLASTTPKQSHPPNSSKLLVFAGVNFAMLVLVPILGRRTTIKFLTFGHLGHQDVGSWYYTGPVTVVLHVASNAINAAIVKSVPGFEHTSITALTFFWCTRPRLAWLIVVLLPYQKEKSMYFAAAASILSCEVILQIIGVYYTGSAVNYAQRQKFLEGQLAGSGYAKQAKIMYASALLWLILVPFVIAALAWSVWEISNEIKRLGRGWTQTKRMVKENCDTALEQVELLKTAHSNMKPIDGVPWQEQVEPLQNHARASLQGVIQQWNELATAWKDMSIRIRRGHNKMQSETQRKQRYEVQLTKVPEETEKYREIQRDGVVLDQKTEKRSHEWRLTVEKRQEEAHAHQVDATRRIPLVQEQRAEVATLLDESRKGLQPFQDRIEREEKRIAADNEDLKSMRCQERKKAADLQAISDAWEVFSKSTRDLRQNWADNEEQWRLEGERREIRPARRPRVGHFQFVVVPVMLLCWIAQWLFWAGYVGVAGDKYNPQKLGLLWFIWTMFSGMGVAIGASF
ncbi:hypothetical protein BDZ45DRAFT_506509 [Acephala macrosclerotiorum]|nr:hypothetical protein BDZ45DRAFT_506509 [Acephala macrosclerotiorum]